LYVNKISNKGPPPAFNNCNFTLADDMAKIVYKAYNKYVAGIFQDLAVTCCFLICDEKIKL